jgi:hypothetical protein
MTILVSLIAVAKGFAVRRSEVRDIERVRQCDEVARSVSRMLENYHPGFDGELFLRACFRAHGAMDELGAVEEELEAIRIARRDARRAITARAAARRMGQ